MENLYYPLVQNHGIESATLNTEAEPCRRRFAVALHLFVPTIGPMNVDVRKGSRF